MNNHSFQTVFKYCPACGSGQFETNNEKSKKCRDCGFVLYYNAMAAVAAFIINDVGELLVCRRKQEPAKDTLDLPGGFVEKYETGEQAVVREIKEELNLDVNAARYLFSIPNIYRYSGLDEHTLDLFFELTVNDFTPLHVADDVEAAYFIPCEQLNPPDFGLESIQKAISFYKQHRCGE